MAKKSKTHKQVGINAEIKFDRIPQEQREYKFPGETPPTTTGPKAPLFATRPGETRK